MRRLAAVLPVVLLIAGLACKGGRSGFSADTVALIDERPVSLTAFRAYFEANAGRPIAESSPKVVSALFDQYLREEIWRREANLHGGDPALERREAPGVLLAKAGARVVPTEAEIDEEYGRRPERSSRPEEARVLRIFTRQKGEAEKARARVLKGEDFGKVARQISQSPDAASGGQVGLVRRGDLPSEFENAIFRLKVGEVSPVLASEDGFLIFLLEEREPARQLSREESAPEIRRSLAREKAQAYLAQVVERARRERRIRVFQDRLPFVYAGSFTEGSS